MTNTITSIDASPHLTLYTRALLFRWHVEPVQLMYKHDNALSFSLTPSLSPSTSYGGDHQTDITQTPLFIPV